MRGPKCSRCRHLSPDAPLTRADHDLDLQPHPGQYSARHPGAREREYRGVGGGESTLPSAANEAINGVLGLGAVALVLILVTRGRLGYRSAEVGPPPLKAAELAAALHQDRKSP